MMSERGKESQTIEAKYNKLSLFFIIFSGQTFLKSKRECAPDILTICCFNRNIREKSIKATAQQETQIISKTESFHN